MKTVSLNNSGEVAQATVIREILGASSPEGLTIFDVRMAIGLMDKFSDDDLSVEVTDAEIAFLKTRIENTRFTRVSSVFVETYDAICALSED